MLHQAVKNSKKWLLASTVLTFYVPTADNPVIAVAQEHLNGMFAKWGMTPPASADFMVAYVALPNGEMFHLIKVALPNDVGVHYIVQEVTETVPVVTFPVLPEGEAEPADGEGEAEASVTYEERKAFVLYHYDIV